MEKKFEEGVPDQEDLARDGLEKISLSDHDGGFRTSISDHERYAEADPTANEKLEEDDIEKNDLETTIPDPFLVDWTDSEDPEHPMNFPLPRRIASTLLFAGITVMVGIVSSDFAGAISDMQKELHSSTEILTLGTSLYVLGFAFGPLFFGPLSEFYGRLPPLFVGYTVFCIWQVPVAVAQNTATALVCRFLNGVFGVAPLTIIGGAMADIWKPVERGIAVTIFTAASFVGPVCGPIISSYATEGLGWRWTMWIVLIASGGVGVLCFPFLRETYAPILLARRAKAMRVKTGDERYYAKSERKDISFQQIISTFLTRPFLMLLQEPILVTITIYISFIYGVLYLTFEAFPYAFGTVRGWSSGTASLSFIAVAVGFLIACLFVVYMTQTRYKRKYLEAGKAIPEERLIPMIVGGAVFPAGMFWFAWTSDPNITWVPQMLATVLIGMGVFLIFLQGQNYMIDTYSVNANSALAANIFLRSFIGAGFPLFSEAMFKNLGVNWASSTLGFITVGLFPVPVLLYIYGEKIRRLSKYVPDDR